MLTAETQNEARSLAEQWRAAANDKDKQQKADEALRDLSARLLRPQTETKYTQHDTLMERLAQAVDADDETALLAVLAEASGLPWGYPLTRWEGEPEPEATIYGHRHDVPTETKANGLLEWPVVSRTEPGVISGEGGSGKSFFALALALAAVTAHQTEQPHGTAMGLRVRAGRVILLGYEDAPNRLLQRYRMLERSGQFDAPEPALSDRQPADDIIVFDLRNLDPLRSGSENGHTSAGQSLTSLRRLCELYEPVHVFVDPAQQALADVSAGDASAVRLLLADLMMLPGNPGVLLVAHDTKAARNDARAGYDAGAGAVSGSGAWYDRPRGLIHIAKMPQKGGRQRRLAVVAKSNHGQPGWGMVLAADEQFSGWQFDHHLMPAAVEQTQMEIAAYQALLRERAKAQAKKAIKAEEAHAESSELDGMQP